MAARTDTFDLSRLQLRAGEGRRMELAVTLEPFSLGAERYEVAPRELPVVLDIARMTGNGWSLRLRFRAELHGPCMRCLTAATPGFDVDAREIDQPGAGPELDSPYVVDHDQLDVHGWARDALALALPQQDLCRPECAGLCAICGEDLNTAGPEHVHEREPDARWAKLSELRFD
jgi:uncharacterized protein